jgi:HNH endonuclease
MKKSFALTVLLVFASAAYARAQHPMRVHYINVGQADSILVELPRAAVLIDVGGPDTIDNMVLACRNCNSSKGARDLFEWYGKGRQYEIPRLALGKYLKLIFELHERAGTLDSSDVNADARLDVSDLGAVLAPALTPASRSGNTTPELAVPAS